VAGKGQTAPIRIGASTDDTPPVAPY